MTEARTAIITGAGSGIGRAAAFALSREGYNVVLVGRTESTLHETASGLADDASRLVHPTDVTDAPACQGVIDATLDRFGRIDALCNIAGFATQQSIPDTTPEILALTLETNLYAVIYLTRAAWPTFASHKGGVIVNVSSMASIDPFPGFAAYASAKAAVNMFTRVTANEGRAINLKAVAIAPGAVETPMLRSMFDTTMIPEEQTLSPQRVASLIVDCVTGERALESGELITV